MAAPALRIETENEMSERTVLEEKVENIEKNVGETRSDIRRLDGKIDSVSDALTGHRVETEKNFAQVNKAIADLRTEMKGEIGDLRTEIKGEIGDLRTETGNAIAGLRMETHNAIGALRLETSNAIAGLRTEMGDLRTEMAAGFGALRVEMRDLIDAFRRDRRALGFAMIGTIIAAVGTAAGVAKWIAVQPAAPLMPAPSATPGNTPP